MAIRISGLNELRERLERLRPEEVMAKALAEQAERMAARVRKGLSEQPGASGHDELWLRSGALRDSVEAQANGLQAAVGSSDPTAVPQELGTAHMPARPFLAPVAAEMGEEVARAVGAAVAAALRGDDSVDADLSRGSFGGRDTPNWGGAGRSGTSMSGGESNAAKDTLGKSTSSSQQAGGVPSSPYILLASTATPIAYNPGDYAPEGALAGPFGEKVVA